MDKLVRLSICIQKSRNEEARQLINELGIEADLGQCTPLNIAVIHGNKEIFDYLMERNANVNALYEGHYSCLMSAAENRDEYMMRALISKGARLDVADKYGKTPFYIAALKNMGNENLLKFFLDNGADASDRDVMSLAKERGKENIVALLEQYKK